MRKLLLYFSIVILNLFVVCQKDQYSESRKLLEESKKIHDEVMPKMAEIMNLQKELKARINSTENNSLKYKELEKAISDLESAHDKMMEWMRNMKNVPDSKIIKEQGHSSPEEILIIQKSQKEEIFNIKKDIYSSISAAENLLK